MKVYLREKKTRRYHAGSEGWAAAAGEARDFISVAQASRTALNERLPEVEIVLKWEMLPDEVVAPVLAEWCNGHQPDPGAASRTRPACFPALALGTFSAVSATTPVCPRAPQTGAGL